MRTSANSAMEDEQTLQKKKPRKLSKAFKKLRQKLHTHASKIEKESGERQRESSKIQNEPSENDKELSENEKESSKNDEELRENDKESSKNESEPREIDKESSKNEKEPEVDHPRPPLPSSTAGGPKAVEYEEPVPKPQTEAPPKTVKTEAEEPTPNPQIDSPPKTTKTEAEEPTPTPPKTFQTDAKEPAPNPQADTLPKTLKTEAEDAGIKLSNIIRPLPENAKGGKGRDSADGKAPMQPGAMEPPSVTHTSSDGSISYFNSTFTANPETEPLFTTPGYEWASRSRGYDWDTRRKIYGGNVLLGEHYERTMRHRSEVLERTYQKVEAEREQPIKVKATGVRTMIASGYWAGSEA